MGPIEWEEIKEAFLGNYFPREKKEVKIEEFIKFGQGNMIVGGVFFKVYFVV